MLKVLRIWHLGVMCANKLDIPYQFILITLSQHSRRIDKIKEEIHNNELGFYLLMPIINLL